MIRMRGRGPSLIRLQKQQLQQEITLLVLRGIVCLVFFSTIIIIAIVVNELLLLPIVNFRNTGRKRKKRRRRRKKSIIFVIFKNDGRYAGFVTPHARGKATDRECHDETETRGRESERNFEVKNVFFFLSLKKLD